MMANQLRAGDWFVYRGEPVQVVHKIRDSHRYDLLHFTIRYGDCVYNRLDLHDETQVQLAVDPTRGVQ
jgi:hypothetical protein